MAAKDQHPHKRPPLWLDKLLERICKPELLEEVLGDLHERYYLRVQKFGEVKAKQRYWLEVIAYIQLKTFNRNSFHTHLLSMDMIRNYFKIAFRNLTRSKAFSLINLVGLALGICSSILIFLWIQDEISVDNFHVNNDQLYQVYVRSINSEKVEAGYRTPALLPEELKQVIPEVKHATGFAKVLRVSQQGDIYETFRVGDKKHKMRGSRAGKDFFKMFSYPLIHGTPETALNDPHSVAISGSMANLFFGSPEAAYGKTITFNNESSESELIVSSVFENIPANSSDQFDYLTNWDTWVKNDEFKKLWGHFGTLTYIQLHSGADPASVEEKIAGLLHNYIDIPKDANFRLELAVQPFGERYLRSNFENGIPSGGRIEYVRLLGIVAIFILFIACINFINLTTARSLKRAKEVGIRKVIGANRHSLVYQFMGEAMLLTVFATILAIVGAILLIPLFNGLIGKQLIFHLFDPVFGLTICSVILLVGLLAGSYPAIFMSALKPVRVIKGTLKFSPGNIKFRKGLVIFQFTLSALLIIATLVITRQTNFIQNKHLGYNKENIIYIPIEGDLVNNYLTFKKEAQQLPGIKFVDRSSQTPHKMALSGMFVRWKGMDESNPVIFTPSSVGYDFVELMDIEIVEGRDFSPDFSTDANSFLVSELAVKEMNLEEPIGSEISVFGKTGPIIGIFRNFHTQSLHQSLQPTVLDVKEELNFGTILVRTEQGRTQEAIASLEKVSHQLNPDYPFTYHFLDNEYQELYRSEQVVASLSNVFGMLAIFISSLGLLGLAIFSAEQRIKEMSIRKVLGASLRQVFALFTQDFLKLVCIALIIALPLAWYIMNQWLQKFAYRIEIGLWIFVVAAVLCSGIALLTVGYQAIRTALVNPADSLRNE